jgi:hypothetical protein
VAGAPAAGRETGNTRHHARRAAPATLPGAQSAGRSVTGRQDVKATDEWVSAETKPKEDDFRGILRMHLQICKGIRSRQRCAPYLYADLYAGRGQLEFGALRFPGSPIVFLDEAREAGMPYEAVYFERDRHEAALLSAAVTSFGPGQRPAIFNEAFETGFTRWLKAAGHQPMRYGLIFSDPIRDEIPHRVLAQAAAMLPRVDILSYVSATQYKRRRGVDPGRPYLSDHVKAVGKKVVLIRRPQTAWHWTFIMFSNWENMPEWRKHGFYRLDSETGAEIMRQLDLSEREHREVANTPLPFDPEPPYRTYGEYLRHPRFLKIRAKVFERASGWCERCYVRPPTEPHHLRYPPWGTFDVPENMIAVCHQCHCDIHGKAA